MEYNFEIFSDYFQFYIYDESARNTDTSGLWNDEDALRKIAVRDQFLGITTFQNSNVPVTIQVLDAELKINDSEWDQIIETYFESSTGHLKLLGCTESQSDEKSIDIKPGKYCVRVLYKNLNSVQAGGISGNESYTIQLFPADLNIKETKLVKNYQIGWG